MLEHHKNRLIHFMSLIYLNFLIYYHLSWCWSSLHWSSGWHCWCWDGLHWGSWHYWCLNRNHWGLYWHNRGLSHWLWCHYGCSRLCWNYHCWGYSLYWSSHRSSLYWSNLSWCCYHCRLCLYNIITLLLDLLGSLIVNIKFILCLTMLLRRLGEYGLLNINII